MRPPSPRCVTVFVCLFCPNTRETRMPNTCTSQRDQSKRPPCWRRPRTHLASPPWSISHWRVHSSRWPPAAMRELVAGSAARGGGCSRGLRRLDSTSTTVSGSHAASLRGRWRAPAAQPGWPSALEPPQERAVSLFAPRRCEQLLHSRGSPACPPPSPPPRPTRRWWPR